MRNSSVAGAAAVSAAVSVTLLAGCGGGPVSPRVAGPVGSRPEVVVPADARPAPQPTVSVLKAGHGAEVRPGDVAIAYVDMHVWQGDKPYLSSYDLNQPTTVSFDGRHVSTTWAKALLGRRGGSRVMLVAPAVDAFGPNGEAPAGVPPTSTLIEVFDVVGGYRPTAQVTGAQTGQAPAGVSVRPGLPPTVSFKPHLPAPDKVTASKLVTGSGPAVPAGGTPVVQFVAGRWGSGQSFDSSYARGGPNGVVLAGKAAPAGWITGLSGARVGDRIFLAIPEAVDAAQPLTTGGLGVPRGSATWAVVDVLGTARF